MALPAIGLLMLVLPQLAGFAAARWWRRSWAWPFVAFVIFAVAWYATIWAPASFAAEQRRELHHCSCGMATMGAFIILLGGLAVHVGGGSFLAWLDRRARRTFLTGGRTSP